MDPLPQRMTPAQARLEILTHLLRKGGSLDSTATREQLVRIYGIVAAGGEKPETLAVRTGCLRLAFGRGLKPQRPDMLRAEVDKIHALIEGKDAGAPGPAADAA